ncbi:MAG: hypothetical protein WD098_13540, partial [Balneolales bacterium]
MPFLLWTAICILGIGLLKLNLISHPLFQYSGRLALLITLPLAFISYHFFTLSFIDPGTLPASDLWIEFRLIVSPDESSTFSASWLKIIIGFVTIVAMVLAVFNLVKLLFSYWVLHQLRLRFISVKDVLDLATLLKLVKQELRVAFRFSLRLRRMVQSPTLRFCEVLEVVLMKKPLMLLKIQNGFRGLKVVKMFR